jgi:hypothetical protein
MDEARDGGDPQPEMRISNDERDAVVELLRDQTSVGRLTLGEFEERLEEVYGARTASQLRHALRELPVEPPALVQAVTPRGSTPGPISEADLRRRYRVRLRNEAAGFVAPNFVCNTIWLLGGSGYWWPGWVLMGTGVGLVSMVVRGFDPEKERTELVAERRKQGIAEIEARHGDPDDGAD